MVAKTTAIAVITHVTLPFVITNIEMNKKIVDIKTSLIRSLCIWHPNSCAGRQSKNLVQDDSQSGLSKSFRHNYIGHLEVNYNFKI